MNVVEDLGPVIQCESLDGGEVLQCSVDVDSLHLLIGTSLTLDSITIYICRKKALRSGVFDECSSAP